MGVSSFPPQKTVKLYLSFYSEWQIFFTQKHESYVPVLELSMTLYEHLVHILVYSTQLLEFIFVYYEGIKREVNRILMSVGVMKD